MITPILNLNPSAVVWHQGEENADDGLDYVCFEKSLITDWRKGFKNTKLPFVFVQLQPCGYVGCASAFIYPCLPACLPVYL
jgi:sialate O-acetylesterase